VTAITSYMKKATHGSDESVDAVYGRSREAGEMVVFSYGPAFHRWGRRGIGRAAQSHRYQRFARRRKLNTTMCGRRGRLDAYGLAGKGGAAVDRTARLWDC